MIPQVYAYIHVDFTMKEGGTVNTFPSTWGNGPANSVPLWHSMAPSAHATGRRQGLGRSIVRKQMSQTVGHTTKVCGGVTGPVCSPSATRVLRVLAVEQAISLGGGLNSALVGARFWKGLIRLEGRGGTTSVAKRVPSIKIEGMSCMRHLSSNKVGCVNGDLHWSVGIRRKGVT